MMRPQLKKIAVTPPPVRQNRRRPPVRRRRPPTLCRLAKIPQLCGLSLSQLCGLSQQPP